MQGQSKAQQGTALGEKSPLLSTDEDPAQNQTIELKNLVHLAAAVVFTGGFLKTYEYYTHKGSLAAIIKIVTFLPPALFIVWFMVQRWRIGGPVWQKSNATHSAYIPARAWTGLYLAAWGLYYILYLCDMKDTYPARELSMYRAMNWNFLLCVALGCTAHLSVDLSNYGPLMLMIVLVPLATPDRIPFSIEPGGCPNVFHHIVGVYALLCALWLLRCRDLRVGTVAERARGDAQDIIAASRLAGSPAPCIVYFEAVTLGCVFFSITYLLAIYFLIWNKANDHTSWDAFADGLYHASFSYLRPLYALVYALYYLKRFRSSAAMELVQACLCGFGLLYFAILCPMAVTSFTKHGATCEHPVEPILHHHYANMYEDEDGEYHNMITPLSKAAHRMESTAFYINMVLFLVHGLCSGSWENDPPETVGFVGAVAWPTFVAFICIGVFIPVKSLIHIYTGIGYDDHETIPNDRPDSYLVWVSLHYWCGYLCGFFPGAHILAWRPRTLVILQPVTQYDTSSRVVLVS